MSSTPYAILSPVLAMLVLSFVVWVWMLVTRMRFFSRQQVDPQTMNTPDAVYRTLPSYAANPGYNFRNLSEVPVLFYAMCFYLAIIGGASHVQLICAWLFVALRVLHSLIQCSYNNVNHRFGAYALSSIALWVMLGTSLAAAI